MASNLCVLCAILLGIGIAQQEGIAQCHRSTVADFSPDLAPKARGFLSSLVASVKAEDKAKIAAMVHYPLTVNTDKGHRVVRTSSEFLRAYTQLFTPAIKKAIEQQAPECLPR